MEPWVLLRLVWKLNFIWNCTEYLQKELRFFTEFAYASIIHIMYYCCNVVLVIEKPNIFLVCNGSIYPIPEIYPFHWWVEYKVSRVPKICKIVSSILRSHFWLGNSHRQFYIFWEALDFREWLPSWIRRNSTSTHIRNECMLPYLPDVFCLSLISVAELSEVTPLRIFKSKKKRRSSS